MLFEYIKIKLINERIRKKNNGERLMLMKISILLHWCCRLASLFCFLVSPPCGPPVSHNFNPITETVDFDADEDLGYGEAPPRQ